MKLLFSGLAGAFAFPMIALALAYAFAFPFWPLLLLATLAAAVLAPALRGLAAGVADAPHDKAMAAAQARREVEALALDAFRNPPTPVINRPGAPVMIRDRPAPALFPVFDQVRD